MPFLGYPENKYVSSMDEAASSPGVFKDGEGIFKVRYNATGHIGLPIVLPNKYKHFVHLAERLGHELRDCLQTVGSHDDRVTTSNVLPKQLEAMNLTINDMKNISKDKLDVAVIQSYGEEPEVTLMKLARDLKDHAPDLVSAVESRLFENEPQQGTSQEIEERQIDYAAIIQMKLLEEANKNWESIFPGTEEIWGFASDRLHTTNQEGQHSTTLPVQKQFFSMRRWPVECQSQRTQDQIAQSGPPFPRGSDDNQQNMSTHHNASTKRMSKRERHIRNRVPYFPFGENSFQQAYVSYRMQKDMQNGMYKQQAHDEETECDTVPGFDVPKPRLLSRLTSRKRKLPVELYSLPNVSKRWQPDNVSRGEKYASLLNFAKTAPGFPDPEILEYYHTQEEIDTMRRRDSGFKNARSIKSAHGT